MDILKVRKTGKSDHGDPDNQTGNHAGTTSYFKDHMSFVPVPGFVKPRDEKTGNEKDESRRYEQDMVRPVYRYPLVELSGPPSGCRCGQGEGRTADKCQNNSRNYSHEDAGEDSFSPSVWQAGGLW